MSNDEKRKTFSLCTFNILAPCYKRLSNEYDRESSYENKWKSRHLSIIKLLQTLEIDLICFQEFWLDENDFRLFYESHFNETHSFYYVQRTHELNDGLAIFLNKTSPLKYHRQKNLYLNDVGNRVGLLLHLKYEKQSILIVNVHLTFPHHDFDRRLRIEQMNRFIQLIDEYRRTEHLDETNSSTIICGDLNSPDENDPVYHQLIRTYKSSYKQIHGKEPRVTHLTHRNDQVCTDFIFYFSKIFLPIQTDLIPKGSNESIWNDATQWSLSDHRAILTRFQFQ